MANSDGKGAVGREIAAAAGAGAIEGDGAQLDMLMPPSRTNLTSSEQARVEKAVKHDRAGRPPGARNVATREMLEFVRKTMGDPLERRFRWAMHTPESLSIVLGCTKLEAFDRLDRIWADLAQLFYAKLAQVDGAGNAVVPRFTMQIGVHSGAVTSQPGPDEPPWEYIRRLNAENQQNQALLDIDGDVSHGDVSHETKN